MKACTQIDGGVRQPSEAHRSQERHTCTHLYGKHALPIAIATVPRCSRFHGRADLAPIKEMWEPICSTVSVPPDKADDGKTHGREAEAKGGAPQPKGGVHAATCTGGMQHGVRQPRRRAAAKRRRTCSHLYGRHAAWREAAKEARRSQKEGVHAAT